MPRRLSHQTKNTFFVGQEFEKGHTLSEYNIQKGSELLSTQQFRRMTIYVETLTRRTISLEVDLNEAVEAIKSKLNKEKAPLQMSRL